MSMTTQLQTLTRLGNRRTKLDDSRNANLSEIDALLSELVVLPADDRPSLRALARMASVSPSRVSDLYVALVK